MATKQKQYHAYLLRAWCDADGNNWRAVLEDVHTSEKQGFDTIAELTHHIRDILGEQTHKDEQAT